MIKMIIMKTAHFPLAILSADEVSDGISGGGTVDGIDGGNTIEGESVGDIDDGERGSGDDNDDEYEVVMLVNGHLFGLVTNVTGSGKPNAPSMQNLKFASST